MAINHSGSEPHLALLVGQKMTFLGFYNLQMSAEGAFKLEGET